MKTEYNAKVYKDYGYLNGYPETPEEVKRCRDLEHELEGRNIGNCANEYFCPICNHCYSIDSSG